jgi:hypothetical protein
VPADVRAAIQALSEGGKGGYADAYSSLQAALTGGGCMRTALPVSVPWGEAVWAAFVDMLEGGDNHVRAAAGQTLCNLAISVPPGMVRRDLGTLYAVTRDDRFVTARHVLQAFWKVGLGDAGLRQDLLDRFKDRFKKGAGEKHYTLVRYDMLVGLRSLFAVTGDAAVKEAALALIPLEDSPKYRKKYESAWKGA